MLKDKKLKKIDFENEYYYGYCTMEGLDGYISGIIKDENIIKEIDGEEYYFVEVKTSASDSDYHKYYYEYSFKGVFLNFNLNEIDTIRYFGVDLSHELFPKSELISIVNTLLKEYNMLGKNDCYDVNIVNGCLKITIPDKKLDEKTLDFCKVVLKEIRNYYSKKGVHITRMFGSYILIKNVKDRKSTRLNSSHMA